MSEDVEKQTIFEEDEEGGTEENQTTSSGMKQNLAGMLCYFAGAITGIIFLLIEKDNSFVRYHAIQSIILTIFIIILNTVLSVIPIIGWLIGILLSPVFMFLWIYTMWKAYQNKRFTLPVISKIARDQVNKNN
ncbi:Uncharacterized membrane protein [Pelagirhabdus alkalitolerans]|uniref:Uncharacterized membrane protein n=1 Tax=Pelagirhabdus alkalitolerans TaxID=1612202 RepID=A0A1G6GGT8_9BACI|nr:DUF4870 domain-containing protein [Pelagirhabdus alkalitolerans]SDB80965.1 Uncharacterized membrane protein [Pelagirhabdus alkalitolerans]